MTVDTTQALAEAVCTALTCAFSEEMAPVDPATLKLRNEMVEAIIKHAVSAFGTDSPFIMDAETSCGLMPDIVARRSIDKEREINENGQAGDICFDWLFHNMILFYDKEKDLWVDSKTPELVDLSYENKNGWPVDDDGYMYGLLTHISRI